MAKRGHGGNAGSDGANTPGLFGTVSAKEWAKLQERAEPMDPRDIVKRYEIDRQNQEKRDQS